MNNNYKKKALSPTMKEIVSEAQALHNDAFSDKHARDIVASLRKRLKYKGFDLKLVDKLCKEHLEEALAKAGYPVTDPEIDLDGLSQIKDLRDNLCFDNGKWTQKSGQSWIDFFIKNRQERSVYKDSSGSILKPGGKRYKSPLKQIFFRLPPWIAIELNDGDEVMVKRTMIQLAESFKIETGLDVIAVNIHKESNHDVHGHLIYSSVTKHAVGPVKLKAKEKREYMAQVRSDIRDELIDAGLKHSPADVKRVRIERGLLEAPKFKNSGSHEYRRVRSYAGTAANSDWPTAKRKLNALGASYRYKAMVSEAAVGDAKKEIQKYGDPFPQAPGSFNSKFVSKRKPGADYLDYWIEKEYADLIYARLSGERQSKIESNKQQCVENYLEYGTTVVAPIEAEWSKIAAVAQKEKDAALHLSQKLKLKDQELELKGAALDNERERITKVEVAANVVLNRESVVTTREEGAVARDTELNERQINILKDETAVENRIKVANQLESKIDVVRVNARRQVFSELARVISPTSKMPKSEKVILKDIHENVEKASILDKVKLAVGTLVSDTRMRKLPRWIASGLSKIAKLIGVQLLEKDKEV